METLQELIEDHYVKPQEIADLLDSMNHAERFKAISTLKRPHQRKLYRKVRRFLPLTVEDFVPSDVPPLTEVIHWGKNTLPAFNDFQKRFCRPENSEGDLLWGYNEQEMRVFTGPGYFVVRPGDEDDPLIVDYRTVPPDKPYGWPDVLSNSARLSRFIYNGTQDKMRRVSKHVTIGAAFRGEQPLHSWFVLCREDRT